MLLISKNRGTKKKQNCINRDGDSKIRKMAIVEKRKKYYDFFITSERKF